MRDSADVAGITMVAVLIASAWRADLSARQTPAPAATSQAQLQSDPQRAGGCCGKPPGLPALLSAVPRYQSSYVLVVPARLAARVPSAAAPGVKEIQVGVHAGTPGLDAARAIGITNLREYRLDMSALGQPLQDVKDARLDAAILWGPLAGLAIRIRAASSSVS